jgi:hypothetical protein
MIDQEAKDFSLKGYEAVLRRILKLLQENFKDDLLACALFGSIARGEATPNSDIDLLVIHRKDHQDRVKEFSKVVLELRKTDEYQMLLRQGFLPEPYPIFLDEEWLKKHPWILLDILDHGVILFDPREILKEELKSLKRSLEELGSYKVNLPDGTWYWVLKPDWRPGEVIQL